MLVVVWWCGIWVGEVLWRCLCCDCLRFLGWGCWGFVGFFWLVFWWFCFLLVLLSYCFFCSWEFFERYCRLCWSFCVVLRFSFWKEVWISFWLCWGVVENFCWVVGDVWWCWFVWRFFVGSFCLLLFVWMRCVLLFKEWFFCVFSVGISSSVLVVIWIFSFWFWGEDVCGFWVFCINCVLVMSVLCGVYCDEDVEVLCWVLCCWVCWGRRVGRCWFLCDCCLFCVVSEGFYEEVLGFYFVVWVDFGSCWCVCWWWCCCYVWCGWVWICVDCWVMWCVWVVDLVILSCFVLVIVWRFLFLVFVISRDGWGFDDVLFLDWCWVDCCCVFSCFCCWFSSVLLVVVWFCSWGCSLLLRVVRVWIVSCWFSVVYDWLGSWYESVCCCLECFWYWGFVVLFWDFYFLVWIIFNCWCICSDSILVYCELWFLKCLFWKCVVLLVVCGFVIWDWVLDF